jgi:hypothetical protein
MDANQTTINAKGTGFKGFIPALFARLVNEAFVRRANGEAEVKLTAPTDRVRKPRHPYFISGPPAVSTGPSFVIAGQSARPRDLGSPALE